MSNTALASFLSDSSAAPLTPDSLNDRLAEAASYAVLRRLVPVLRHDVAGAMQPIRMLLMVLERRTQAPEPDLQAVAKNITSVSGLTKQATADCMNALSWIAASEDAQVGLRTAVDDAIKLLNLELSAKALVMINAVVDDAVTAPQSFLHTVFMGALLAFCDQQVEKGTLQVTLEASTAGAEDHHRLHLRMLPEDTNQPSSAASMDIIRKYRMIGWEDVQAMARSMNADMAHGEGWATLGLPKD